VSGRRQAGAPANGRKNGLKGAVRESIVASAAELFRERGFASTSMQDIADAVGLSRPALYYHFTNKDEILASLVEDITLKTARDTARLAEGGGDPVETLRRVVRAHALWILRHPQHFAVLQRDENNLPAAVRVVQNQGKRELLDAFVQLLRIGTRAGRFRQTDPSLTALSIFGMCNWTTQWFRPGGRLGEEAAADAIADLALAMVLRPASSEPGRPDDPRAWLSVLKDDLAQLERSLPPQDKAID
jgi:AcrR family transcriptional regulator